MTVIFCFQNPDMVRKYQRTYRNCRKGKHFLPYTSYDQECLERAVAEIKYKAISIGEAAQKYNIPNSTLSRKYRGLNSSQRKAGHPTLFSFGEEQSFVAHLKLLGDWGFPFDTLDLRVFAQKYLNKIDKTLYNLKDNLPGALWANNFLVRHQNQLSNRCAANISTERAKLTEEQIDEFFSNYLKNVEGVSPDCIINYDETNLTDDPGSFKYIFKKGKKYTERVINNSKTAVSLMFAGATDGTILPRHVVYKAEHLWDSWMEGGPEKTR